jgi:hypothetical protein
MNVTQTLRDSGGASATITKTLNQPVPPMCGDRHHHDDDH